MKSQVPSIAALLLTSNLCSTSSASLFDKGLDDVISFSGLRGLGRDLKRERANRKLSEPSIKEEPEEDEPEEQARRDDTRIIGGYEATPNEHSYTVSLEDDMGHFCGGTLITKTAVLTAAHCQGGRYRVALGRHDLDTEDGQVIGMRKELPHEGYDDFTTDNDFMVVFLERPATLNSDVSLVTLNNDLSVPRVGDVTTVVGWGDTHISDDITEMSDVLMQVQVGVISNADCDDSAGSVGGFYEDYHDQITSNMLCTRAHLKDGCQGDSGGPLVTTSGVQVGVVSWGISCASSSFPGVFARVSQAYGWIEREVCSENRQHATEAGFRC